MLPNFFGAFFFLPLIVTREAAASFKISVCRENFFENFFCSTKKNRLSFLAYAAGAQDLMRQLKF
jgi:hypothetical protein